MQHQENNSITTRFFYREGVLIYEIVFVGEDGERKVYTYDNYKEYSSNHGKFAELLNSLSLLRA